MDFLTNPQFWAGWVRIVVIDLLLAGDNALVIALALIATSWIRDPQKYRQFVIIPCSLLIAAMGLWWMVERIRSA